MSVSQLETFVAVAEEGHLTRAARRLHVSQPPVSRKLRALEDELGVPLFERSSRGMRLLPAGETFLEHARRVLAAIDEARLSVHACNRCAKPLCSCKACTSAGVPAQRAP